MWLKIKNWFRHSETIAWARVNIAAGVVLVLTVFAGVDLTPYLTGKYLIGWVIFNGFITEILRRKNTVTVSEIAPSGEVVQTMASASPPSEMTSGDAGTTASEVDNV